MPRKQRFKPSRKPKPVTEAEHAPTTERTSTAKEAAGLEPGPREESHEVHPDDVEIEGAEPRSSHP